MPWLAEVWGFLVTYLVVFALVVLAALALTKSGK